MKFIQRTFQFNSFFWYLGSRELVSREDIWDFFFFSWFLNSASSLAFVVLIALIFSPIFLIFYTSGLLLSYKDRKEFGDLAYLEEAQTGIKIARRNINNLRYADDTTLTAESEEELKSLLMKVKEECEKVGLKLNIQKNKIMASGLITSWHIDGETVETVSDFIFFWAPRSLQMVIAAITLKDAYSLEGKLWPTYIPY